MMTLKMVHVKGVGGGTGRNMKPLGQFLLSPLEREHPAQT